MPRKSTIPEKFIFLKISRKSTPKQAVCEWFEYGFLQGVKLFCTPVHLTLFFIMGYFATDCLFNMPQLEEKLRGMSTSNPNAIELLLNISVSTYFSKGSIIGMPDHSFPVLYYLENGLVRTFINHDGEEHTFWIMETGFILPPKGFFGASPSVEFIQVLEDSKIWSLNLAKAELVAKQDQTLYRMLLEIYEEKINNIHEQMNILNIGNALKRFTAFMEKHRDIPSRVDNSHLASLLRLNPKHLYRVKNKYYRNH